MEKLHNAYHVSGKCSDMCPASEMKFREMNNLLNVFETMKGHEKSRRPRCDPTKCVKEFRRSAAGERLDDPDQLRPPKVLLRTVDYLLQEIASREDFPFAMIYDFVFDRLRSVRQDMVIQQIHVEDPFSAALIIEKCYRFYAYALFLIKRHNITSIDRHIHRTHMKQCLQSLMEIYRVSPLSECPKSSHFNIAEFVACNLIFNTERSDILEEILQNFPKMIRRKEPSETTINILYAISRRNFVRVFKLFLSLKSNGYYLVLLSFLDSIDKYRSEAIGVLSQSHNSKQCSFPTNVLMKWLLLNDNNAVLKICKEHGMNVNMQGNVVFQKVNFCASTSSDVHESFLDCCDSVQDLANVILKRK